MRRRIIASALLLLALAQLFGCAAREDKHPEWGEELVRAGDLAAAAAPEGFELAESNDALSLAGIYYFTWAKGEGHAITNDQDQEATVYDAQLYLLVVESADEAEAEKSVQDWLTRERDTYETGEPRELLVNDQAMTALPLLNSRADNPYARGAAAFWHRGAVAFSAELLTGAGFEEAPEDILEGFLSGIRYGN